MHFRKSALPPYAHAMQISESMHFRETECQSSALCLILYMLTAWQTAEATVPPTHKHLTPFVM